METSLTIDRKVSNKTKKTSELPASQKVEGSKLTDAELLRQLAELTDAEWRKFTELVKAEWHRRVDKLTVAEQRREIDDFVAAEWHRRNDKKPDAERRRQINELLKLFNTIDYDPDYDYKAERFRR